jgi:hypothetical protein
MGRMDDHLNEHEAEPETGPPAYAEKPEAVAPTPADGPARLAGPEPGSPDGLAVPGTAAPVATTPDPWVVLAHDQNVRLKAASRRRNKRVLIASGAAVFIIAAGVGGVIASSRSGAPGAGVAPAAFVVSSTQTTLNQRTADVTYSGSVSADGQNIPLSGTGQVDFDTNTFSATLNENVSSTTIAIRELIESGQFYMGMTIDGQDMSQFTGGAHWVGISLPDQASSSGLGAANVDPISQLKALEQKGASVTSLGTKTIDGTTVSGYSVTPTRQEIQSEIQQEVQQNKITAVTAQQMEQAGNLLGSFTTEVWIDGSGLVRQENENIASGSEGIAAKAVVTFQNYGVPVSVSVPSPSDVIPFNQFLNDLKSARSSSQG